MNPTVGLRPAVELPVGLLTALTLSSISVHAVAIQQISQTPTAATEWSLHIIKE